jgi:F-type H+-transporting ATPase subunit b
MKSKRIIGLLPAGLALLPGAARAEGLPQLDASTYAPQLIWLAISFALLYVLMSRLVLPKISQVLDERTLRIDTDLEKAGKLKAEADEVKATYEKAVATSRANAQDVLRQAADRLAADAAERHAALAARLGSEVKAAEARILDAKNKAIADIRGAAVETAQAATQKLIGEVPDAQSANAAVDAVLGARR